MTHSARDLGRFDVSTFPPAPPGPSSAEDSLVRSGFPSRSLSICGGRRLEAGVAGRSIASEVHLAGAEGRLEARAAHSGRISRCLELASEVRADYVP